MAKKDIKFPSISRIINDRNFLSIFFGTLFILIAIGFLTFDLRRTYLENKAEIAQKQQLISEQIFWQQTLNKYPDYRDGYLALAKVDFELGDREEALKMVDKSLEIDPNYVSGLDFQKIIEGN